MEQTWITETGLKVLETMERYQFMTAKQIKRAGKFKNIDVVRRQLRKYAEGVEPFLHFKDFGRIPGFGRLHKMHALNERGAAVLAEYRGCDVSEIPHLVSKINFSRDYMHRVQFVDSHIVIREWAEGSGAEIPFFVGYFQVTGANRTEKGKEKLRKINRTDLDSSGKNFIVPDGIFRFDLGNKSRLCAMEIHRGKDTKTIVEQLEKHVEAFMKRAIQDRFKHPVGNFILSVSENEGTMKAVKKRVRNNPKFEKVMKAFHFCTEAGMAKDIRTAWALADDTPVSIFE